MQLQHPFLTVTPGVDGDVLQALAPVDAWLGLGAILAKAPHRSSAGIKNSLARLESQGVVLASREARSFRYRLNRDHLAAPAIMQLADLKRALVARLSDVVSGWKIQPLFAAIFGSGARGEQRVDSDLDLFAARPLEADEQQWEKQLADLAELATRLTGNDARVLEFSASEWERWHKSGSVLQDIVAEGIALGGDRTAFERMLRYDSSEIS